MFKFIGNRIKKTANNFSAWANLPAIKNNFGFMKRIFGRMFQQEQGPNETFQEAVQRLHLTPEQLEKRKKIFKTQVLIYALGALAVAIYTIYLVIQSYWISVLPSFLIVIFLIVSALKSHFWLFQLKQQKLGCTLQEYFQALLKEMK